ncbi:glycogen/starch synthase [Spirochaeta isovalerica]|uniref:starch synthase n=1 Tax=Spirochaeta isovalerica TaxID=150 RepID=A0A841R6U6_9SPIO|nr:starch synthase [Spirochaeta isovalerica]
MNIWQVSREMSPLAEAGGIKDVVYGLSRALVSLGHEVTVVLPMYRFLEDKSYCDPLVSFPLRGRKGDEQISLYPCYVEGIRVLLVKAAVFLSKDRVYTYSMREEGLRADFQYGKGHLDANEMNLTLQYAALEGAMALGELPEVFHLHDGHCGFLPAIMRTKKRYSGYFSRSGTLLTIHNGGAVYQQNIEDFHEVEKLTGLSHSVLKSFHTPMGWNPLLCAGLYGKINTVSERYAEDVMSGKDINSGLIGELFHSAGIELIGITNGIDPDHHDRCSHSPVLKNGTHNSFTEKKRECRALLIKRIADLEKSGYLYGAMIDDDRPLFTLQSRIAYQKGIDVLADFLERYASDLDARFLVLGEGDRDLEARLAGIAGRIGNFAYFRYYDPSLSADVFAGGDFFLVPSQWEPCGLTDFIAQLNGNIPIVHETGGLVKTKDRLNGFSYSPNTPERLAEKVREAIYLYGNDREILHQIRKNAVNIINEKYTWRQVLDERYIPLYRSITGRA